MARSKQYDLPASNRGDPRGMSDYIRETARKYGIDPEVALRVAKSEGLSTFRSGVRTRSGKEEPSWGAFQLYTGGGLGNQFQKETGLDPSDPKNEKATIDYALKTAAKVGWKPWHGAANTGIGEWEGISGRGAGTQTARTDAASGYGGIGSDTAASERASQITPTGSTDTAQTTPQTTPGAATGDWLDKLKQSTDAQSGLSAAVTGLGQAVAGTGLKGTDTAPRVAPTPVPVQQAPQVVPMVDPRAAEANRQQLAAAMARLNSGRLF